MKIKYVLAFATVAIITGCGYNRLEGSNFDTYIQNNGTPTNYYTMHNGNKLYFYKTRCVDSRNWEEYNVEVTPENTVIGKTYIKSCPYIKKTSSNNQQYSNTSIGNNSTEMKITALHQESQSLLEESKRILQEWYNVKREKGTNHPEAIALGKRLQEISDRSEQINKEVKELNNKK